VRPEISEDKLQHCSAALRPVNVDAAKIEYGLSTKLYMTFAALIKCPRQ
jgi:hypothetical protein